MAQLDEVLNLLNGAEIDFAGVFNYILVEIYPKGEEVPHPLKTVVWGHLSSPNHADEFVKLTDHLEEISGGQLIAQCIGGGKIEWLDTGIHVCGSSELFGKANHAHTVEILQSEFVGINVSYSNED